MNTAQLFTFRFVLQNIRRTFTKRRRFLPVLTADSFWPSSSTVCWRSAAMFSFVILPVGIGHKIHVSNMKYNKFYIRRCLTSPIAVWWLFLLLTDLLERNNELDQVSHWHVSDELQFDRVKRRLEENLNQLVRWHGRYHVLTWIRTTEQRATVRKAYFSILQHNWCDLCSIAYLLNVIVLSWQDAMGRCAAMENKLLCNYVCRMRLSTCIRLKNDLFLETVK